MAARFCMLRGIGGQGACVCVMALAHPPPRFAPDARLQGVPGKAPAMLRTPLYYSII